MKPNELMIGDWVIDAGITSRTVYKRINRTDERSNSCVADDYKVILGEAGIKPIPITPKILENNGWKSYSHENKTIYGIIQGFEITLAYMDYYWQLCVDGTIYRKIKINYVHELQHAMHLMRLHDMANNFKVKGGKQ